MFQIDVMSRTPVYEQIIDQMERFVLTGVFPAGTKIPSVRGLSVSLSINPSTIQKAYSELDRRGVIYSVPGKGCFVADHAAAILRAAKSSGVGELKEKVAELAAAGVAKEELLAMIEEVYASKSSSFFDHLDSGKGESL